MYDQQTMQPKQERLTEMYPLFVQAIWMAQLKLDLAEIRAEILALKQQNPGRTLSNQGGWQSQFLDRSLPWVGTVVEQQMPLIKSVLKEQGYDHEPTLVGSWANVNPPGSFNWPHDHPGALLSSTVWIQVPPESGRLVFDSPMVQAQPPVVMTAVAQPQQGVNPEANLVAIWSSHLTHRVDPNLSQDLRISMAFNWR